MRKGIMLADKLNMKRLDKWPVPWIVQPKINGRRCLAVCGKDSVTLLSSQGNEITGVPHINRSLSNCKNVVWDGELYSTELDFETLASVCSSRRDVHWKHPYVQYWIFDHVGDAPMYSRNNKVHHTVFGPDIVPVPYWRAVSVTELDPIYKLVLAQGFEGVIIRDPDAPYVAMSRLHMMKMKPLINGRFKIVSCQEEVSIYGMAKGALGSVECITEDGIKFSVGSGFTRSQREILWEVRQGLLGKHLHIRYAGLTKYGKPFFTRFDKLEVD